MSQSEILAPETVLICTVGGSPAPLIKTLQEQRPRHLIFVCSAESKAMLAEIISQADLPRDCVSDIATLADHEDLLGCVRQIRTHIQKYLREQRLPQNTLLVADITGGTKIMSAALTLVMMEFPETRFTYIGGSLRGKAGLGTVEPGHEQIRRMDNPWDAMGLRQAKELVQAFNSGHYVDAQNLACKLMEIDEDYGNFYRGLSQIFSAFDNWERFDHRAAEPLLRAGLGLLKPYAHRNSQEIADLVGELKECQALLEAVKVDGEKLEELQSEKKTVLPADSGRAYLCDLLANAVRKARRGQYDDAVARLYSAVEKSVKIALAKLGKNNSALTEADLAEAGEDYVDQYARELEENGSVKLPLEASFTYLKALDPDHPLACAYGRHKEELKNTLEIRNKSLLAHGYTAVKDKHYNDLLAVVLDFLELTEEDLPRFPELELKAILF